MPNYEVILKYSYEIYNVANEDEAYEEAVALMKMDTHPYPPSDAEIELIEEE